MIGAGVHGKARKDWVDVWNGSQQRDDVLKELEALKSGKGVVKDEDDDVDLSVRPKNLSGDKIRARHDNSREFATSWWNQFVQLYIRLNIVFWRNPSYKYVISVHRSQP